MVDSRKKVQVLIFTWDSQLASLQLSLLEFSDDFVVVGICHDFDELLAEIIRKRIEIVVMNCPPPPQDISKMLQRLRRDYHFVDIVVTGVSPQSDVLFPILRAGVGGLLSKKDSVFRFVDALRLVAGGGTPLSDDLTKLIFQDYQINLSSPMTRRETEVLTMMAEGKTYSQVAHELNIANETSKKHIRSIYQKLNVASRSEAISKARSEKWIRLV